MKSEKLKMEEADLAVCENADSFLQSAMWGRFKSRFEWQAHAFMADWEHGGAKPLMVLSRRIAPGIGMAYVPWGPELPADFPDDPSLKANALPELARALRPFLPRTTAFIRFDPPWEGEWGVESREQGTGEKSPPSLRPYGPPLPPSAGDTPATPPNTTLRYPLKRATADIQPPDTVLVDLTPSTDAILAAMKQKWRYNIGLAEKHGVVVNETGANGLDVFYRLLAETADRDGIAIHNIDYYRTLFEECNKTQTTSSSTTHYPLPTTHLKLYTAAHEGDILAAIVVLFRGKEATYLYGASANVKRNLMAPYALQWKAMRDAKEYGCTVYDLFGIPPHEDPDHPMAGLYRFKTGFGGSIIHRPGSWDYPCRPLRYALFRCAEQLRKKMRDRRKRR